MDGYVYRRPYSSPVKRGAPEPDYVRMSTDGMLVERNVRVPMRDGVEILVDLFRPTEEASRVAPIIGWSPYGKHEPLRPERYRNSGVKPDSVSPYTAFEAPDPVYWVARGYAVIVADIRGTWHSGGDATYVSPEEARDYFDLIEWAGVQEWSNGRVGLSGVSYLTVMQWRVAELSPPHLAAIAPFEGWTDTYREVARHGGIPDSWFWPLLHERWGVGNNKVEDLSTEGRHHPFCDDYWRSKAADPRRITVPAYVTASWTDQGLHTRGTLEAFKNLASEAKWLEVHSGKKWARYYEPEYVERLRTFFDQYLLGKDTAIKRWPPVRLTIRKQGTEFDVRHEKEWPLARTRYTPLYLNAEDRSLQFEPVNESTTASYASAPVAVGSEPERLSFDITFESDTELTGHMKLKLWVSAEQGDDMDLFIGIEKLDRRGSKVHFPYYAQFDDGPVALGWLRVSHRELDEQRSTPHQPILAHRRALPLEQDEIVPVEIEIWPSATEFAAGESLRLLVQGSDLRRYPKESVAVYFRHEDSVNRGLHYVHAGGSFDAHLLVPIVT